MGGECVLVFPVPYDVFVYNYNMSNTKNETLEMFTR